MLGPGMIVLGVGAAMLASLSAVRHASDRGFAVVALCISTLELAALLTAVGFSLLAA
jgi:hypothetical protein